MGNLAGPGGWFDCSSSFDLTALAGIATSLQIGELTVTLQGVHLTTIFRLDILHDCLVAVLKQCPSYVRVRE